MLPPSSALNPMALNPAARYSCHSVITFEVVMCSETDSFAPVQSLGESGPGMATLVTITAW
ncbi:hypothetical protein M404DRAFT_557707 [Pisolithus tinctorius Marx 270]|uniref:Uncharacterized protein n=1 Tax=Pisolithus tinctorius Marx 270 TaxID=870435 RepID=A0A0C3P935_PISTI|nr:hypothetical protein M404DRAFT_557707 [Pisolithus tinctorius Marx 270]